MKSLQKIIPLAFFGLVMLFAGSMLAGQAFAQVSPLVCSGESAAGFSGWILCRIGMPSEGIGSGGAAPAIGDTLFKGQKILAKKIDDLSASGQDQYVYITKGDSNPSNCPSGRCNKIKLGKFLTSPIVADFSGVSPFNFIDLTSSSVTAEINNYNTTVATTKAYFIPTADSLVGIPYIERDGVRGYATLCEVETKLLQASGDGTANGVKHVTGTGIQCTYSPTFCNYSSSAAGCLTPAQRMVWSEVYSVGVTPETDQYRFILQ